MIGDLGKLYDIHNEIISILGRNKISFSRPFWQARVVSETVPVRPCVETTTVHATWSVLLPSLQNPSQDTPASEEFCLLPVILLVFVDIV
jgi:hypothetical protein